MKNPLLRSRYWAFAVSLLLAALALWSCNSGTLQQQLADHENQLKTIDEDTIQRYLQRNNLVSKATRTTSGLYVVSVVDGTGPAIATGKQVTLKYVGRFLSNGAHPESSGFPASFGNPNYPAGAIFWNTVDSRTTCGCVVYTAGTTYPAGLNEGLLLMHKGDRKLLLMPSRLAYGSSGSTASSSTPGVPPDSALLYDVEILDVQ
jgi:FKBP-type peptidyl-prolyl cis-trans isomerase